MEPAGNSSNSNNSPTVTRILQDQDFPSGIIRPRMLAASPTMAEGDMYRVNADGIFERFAAGSANQVLTVTGGVPAWSSVEITNQFPTVTALSGTTPALTCTGSKNIIFTLTMTGNTTYSITGAQAGQLLMGEVTQGSGTSYTNTWFSGITWVTAGGTAPVQTTTSNGITTYGFRVLSASTFLGYLVSTQ